MLTKTVLKFYKGGFFWFSFFYYFYFSSKQLLSQIKTQIIDEKGPSQPSCTTTQT